VTLSSLVLSIAWLRQYRREWLRPDVVAGLTAAAVVNEVTGSFRVAQNLRIDMEVMRNE
jgi:hypothetical protein